jgi:hypothetical protein
VVLKCAVKAKNIKSVTHSREAGNWKTEGYDAVQCVKTNLSTKMEMCVAETSLVRVKAWRYASSSDWTKI